MPWWYAALGVGIMVALVWMMVPARDHQQETVVPERMPLWGANAAANEPNAFVTVYKPQRTSGAAVVICPGGGYGAWVLEAEGHRVARWLNRHGIVGVVLEYRLPHGQPERPLADAQQAIRTLRRHAAAWGVQTNQIGILGFSAGGHLAAMAATVEEPVLHAKLLENEAENFRPDFVLLLYPVISMDELADSGSRLNLLGSNPTREQVHAFSADQRVTSRTPPMFLVHARDDAVVSEANSQRMVAALRAQGVPVAFHPLESGGHGLGYGGRLWEQWQQQALEWMRNQDIPVFEK
jgi:acetyl esterase/lipase